MAALPCSRSDRASASRSRKKSPLACWNDHPMLDQRLHGGVRRLWRQRHGRIGAQRPSLLEVLYHPLAHDGGHEGDVGARACCDVHHPPLRPEPLLSRPRGGAFDLTCIPSASKSSGGVGRSPLGSKASARSCSSSSGSLFLSVIAPSPEIATSIFDAMSPVKRPIRTPAQTLALLGSGATNPVKTGKENHDVLNRQLSL